MNCEIVQKVIQKLSIFNKSEWVPISLFLFYTWTTFQRLNNWKHIQQKLQEMVHPSVAVLCFILESMSREQFGFNSQGFGILGWTWNLDLSIIRFGINLIDVP